MDKGDVVLILSGIFILSLFSGLGYFFFSLNQTVNDAWQARDDAIANYRHDIQQFENVLSVQGFTVLQAKFDSPAVSVICPSLQDFYSRAQQLNTKTIYQVDSPTVWIHFKVDGKDATGGSSLAEFYVIDSTATYAYYYTLPMEDS